MSRAYTVGPRTHTQIKGRETQVNASKTSSTAGTAGVGNRVRARGRARGLSTTQRASVGHTSPKLSTSSNPTKSSEVRTNSPPKPRVVTLANLNQTSGARRKKPNRTLNKTITPKNKSVKPSGTAGKTGKDSKMWEDESSSSRHRSLQGDRNVGVYGGNGLGRGASSLSNSTGSPAAGSRMASDRDGQQAGEERRETYQPNGGYTRVTPDPKKREKLTTQASQELERLAAYKEQKKLGRVSIIPSRIGGSKMSEEEARRKQQREQENKKYELIRKRQKWADENKQREDKEHEEKKAMAREQAEMNKWKEEQRQREMRQERQRWLQDGGPERLRCRDAEDDC